MKRTDAKQKLIKAFFDLLETHHYTKISVTDLITEANCSRTTFYRHYTDVIDMYNKICEEIVQTLLKELTDCFIRESFGLSEMFDEFCAKLESQKNHISLLCGKNGGRAFFEIGLDQALASVSLFNPSLSDREKFIMKFVVFSLIGSYVKSLMDGTEFDKRYLEICKSLLVNTGKEGAVFG